MIGYWASRWRYDPPDLIERQIAGAIADLNTAFGDSVTEADLVGYDPTANAIRIAGKPT